MNILKQKIILAIILLFAFSFKLFANESITFTWRGGLFAIVATPGKQFTINWGDGSAIETITASENADFFTNTYTNGYYLYTVTINALSNDCKFTFFESYNGTMNSLIVSNAPSLIGIYCDRQKLATLDISKNTALQILRCNNNQLKNLDVSENVNLTKLHCAFNQLENLDVSKNIALTELDCSYNQIKALNLTKNTKLLTLSCDRNSITSLDVSKCIDLKTLECQDNKIGELDISNNKSITSLTCDNNNITNLNLGNGAELTSLYCYNNKLKSLDVSKCTNLQFFNCSNNQITAIDVSKNLKLEIFACSFNQLTTLDVSKNKVLGTIWCDSNRIKKIELNLETTYDKYLFCMNNQLPLSELYFLSNSISCNYCKEFGTQRLVKKYIPPGSNVDFSSQKEFGGIKTVFIVEKDGVPAPEDDYTLIDDGIFKFYNKGDYTITMTNDAIISDPDYPAKVIAEVSVREVGIAETQHAMSLQIYPNPVSNTLYINLENTSTPPEVKIYSLQGVLVLQTNGNQIDVSSLPAGFYVANVNGINRKIIKQ